MKQKRKSALLVTLFFALFVGLTLQAAEANFRVIPLPNDIKTTKGAAFTLNANTKIVYPRGNAKMQRNAELLSDYLKDLTGNKLAITTLGGGNAIVLKTRLKAKNPEAYRLEVSAKTITITGVNEAAAYFGIQTLRKATPAGASTVTYPAVVINDEPRFSYRGMHLDVGRHMFTVDSVKRYIDILAMHNINTFHWHLTEDQGWRIEIKKYPKLTEVGAWRDETAIRKFFPGADGSFKGDGKRYGGFYTQDEARDIVRYAADRHITVIPEIDMPGHMLAALAAYPELGNGTGPYEVAKWWGVFDQILAPKEKTFTFLENVLAEIMDIFPSKYIHIGGDEAPKTEWKTSAQAQEVIKNLGLKDDTEPNKADGIKHTKEEKLQSYFITRIEKFLNSKGRQIIGWDEILEGQLAPNATVMSWRGMEGGITAAKMGHNVIMTPGSHVYFDHYQSREIEKEPFGIGGYTTVERVYSFEPVPSSLTPEQQKYILGTQANVWTEYIHTFKHVEYMTVPRLAALCEVQWMQPQKKNYTDFLTRLPQMIKLYDVYGYNYATHIFDVQPKFTSNTSAGKLEVELASFDNAPIYYTLNGDEPTEKSTLYTGKFNIDNSVTLKAKSIRQNGQASRTFTENIRFNKATLKPITLTNEPSPNYVYGGAAMLVDGRSGADANYRTGHWLGFQGRDLEAVIDLQNPTEISKAAIHTCVVTGDWIMDAQSFEVAVSDDGKNFSPVAGIETNPNDVSKHWKGINTHTVTFKPLTTRYVKVTVKPFYEFPKWHGAKGKAYVFVDEISLY